VHFSLVLCVCMYGVWAVYTKTPRLTYYCFMFSLLYFNVVYRVFSDNVFLQGRIKPVSLWEAISVIFGIQVSLRVHYCKRDEVYFTTLL